MRYNTHTNNGLEKEELIGRRTGDGEFDWTYNVTFIAYNDRVVAIVATLVIAFAFAGDESQWTLP